MKLFRKLTQLQIAVITLVVAALVGFSMVYFVSSLNSDTGSAYQSDCKETCVALGKDGAKPDTISVALNSYVQFNSADGKSHNLSIGKGGEDHQHTGKFYSGEFKSDEGWRVQFNKEGTYQFHDHLNPDINVLVVVYQPGKEYKIE